MCKYLKGDGKDWYQCSFLKKRCPYQRFCTDRHKFMIDGEQKCPAFKEK